MNKDNARNYLPLVKALAEGKVIQSRMFSCDPWKDCARPDFTMDSSNYRIKPEPREILRNRTADGVEGPVFPTKESAIQALGELYEPVTQVRYREVIE